MEYIPLIRICLIIGGMLQILYFISILYKIRKSKRWSTVTGKILFSELIRTDCYTGNVSNTYRAIVKYQYQVGEKIYFSKKIYYGDRISISLSFYMKKIVNWYSVGTEPVVYYNPQKPEKSVLMVTLAPPVYFLLLSALIFIGIGTFQYII